MTTLLLAEHDNKVLKDATPKALTAAKALGQPVHVLVAGKNCRAVAEAAAKLDGVTKVLLADGAGYEHMLAEPVAALILSLAGIYAVIAHSVAQRTFEIGIRIAMGASPARVTGLMLRYGLLPVICGMIVGWSGAFAISRLFSAMLFDVGPLDVPTWILVSGSMLAVACIASYLPARRASTVDPTVALRAD